MSSRLPKTVDLAALIKVIDQSERLRAGTQRNYRAAVEQWIDFAGVNPAKWSPELARDFYARLKKDKGVSAANGIMWGVRYAVGRVFKDARELSPIDVELARPRVKPQEDDKALDGAEARKLLKACRGNDIITSRDHAIALLGFFTGMRRMSLVGVNLDESSIEAAFVRLNVPIKGGSVYPVTIDHRVWQLLEPYRRLAASYGILHGPLFRRFSQHQIAANERVAGPQLSEDGLYKALTFRAGRAGLDDFHPHILRHTFVTWCSLAGLPTFDIAVITGHKGYGEIDRVYKDRLKFAPRVVGAVYEIVAPQLGV